MLKFISGDVGIGITDTPNSVPLGRLVDDAQRCDDLSICLIRWLHVVGMFTRHGITMEPLSAVD